MTRVLGYKESVETDINKRWEQGMPHHLKSMEIYCILEKMDWEYCDDHFCWKAGGDGDNGEALMYCMDIYFEQLDAGERDPIQIPEHWILEKGIEMPREEAKTAIQTYFDTHHGEKIYPSDIWETLNINYILIQELIEELEGEGKVRQC